MKKGHCRSCWTQARLDRSFALGGAIGTYTALLPHVRRVGHHQLFLDGLPAPRDLVGGPRQRRYGVGSGAPGLTSKRPPPPAGRPRTVWIQLTAFEHGPRDYRRRLDHRRVDRRTHPTLDNPWLAWALHLAHTLAEARGFDGIVFEALNRALIMVLADHTSGDMVRFSDLHQALRGKGCGTGHTAHVLDQMDLLQDDRTPAIDGWLTAKLHGVAPVIARHVLAWARLQLDGGPRTKPRHEKTVRIRVVSLRPALLAWSDRHEHLREITRDEILDQIRTLHGQDRRSTVAALKSLFRWAKANGIVFRDPTARIRAGRVERPIPQPLTLAEITPTIRAADMLHARLAVALAAIHAARHGDILAMQLSDVDLGNRRLSIAGHDRPLDQMTATALTDWLDYRRRRWPNTANPHLLISQESALHLGPVSHPWINRNLRGLTATLERLRIDRKLDEALTTGADPLHLAEVFGLSETTAIRYANAARQILATGAEEHASAAGPDKLPTRSADHPQ